LDRTSRHSALLIGFVCVLSLGASLRNDLVWGSRKLVLASPSTMTVGRAFASFVPSRWRANTWAMKESYRPVANV